MSKKYNKAPRLGQDEYYSQEIVLDQITASDFQIFQKAARDANWFTQYYLKSEDSGTWWRKNTADPQRFQVWDAIRKAWVESGRPPEIFMYQDVPYKVLRDIDGDPVFFYNHGPLWIDWQLKVHHAKQFVSIILGGVGSGKTKIIPLSMLTHAATVPFYRGMVLARYLDQAKQAWDYMRNDLEGTEYARRWVQFKNSDPPELIIRNSYVKESRIVFRAVAEHDVRKILTKELDEMYVDQVEGFEEFNLLLQVAGSRMRGMVRGRERLAKLRLIANAADNEEFWVFADRAQEEPDNYLFLNPWTEHNPFLTAHDLENFYRIYPTEEERDQWMHGRRPIGGGEIFTAQITKLCINRELNELLNDAPPDWFVQTESGLGLYRYEMPPEDGRIYIQIADPGSSNPPSRNSAPIMIWDITEFPGKPARLVGFNWVFGNGNYQTFVDEYVRLVHKYRTQTRNGFDSTGVQKMLQELVFDDRELASEGIDMSGTKKYATINSARYLMGKGLLEFPYIPYLATQMSRYKLPEPAKLSQDLVMALCMSAWYITRFYNIEAEEVMRDRFPLADAGYLERNTSRRAGRNMRGLK